MEYVLCFRARPDWHVYAIGAPTMAPLMVVASALDQRPADWSYILYGPSARGLRWQLDGVEDRAPYSDALRWYVSLTEVYYREAPPRLDEDVPEAEPYAGDNEWNQR